MPSEDASVEDLQAQEHKTTCASNLRKWERCIVDLHPGDRELLEHGGIDPSRRLRTRDDRYLCARVEELAEGTLNRGIMDKDLYISAQELREIVADEEHPGRFSHAAPLSFMEHWIWLVGTLRPPPEHAFHRFWKLRRQQEMGLVPHHPAAATTRHAKKVPKSQRKKSHLAKQVVTASASEVDDEALLQPRRMAHELQVLLQEDCNQHHPGWLSFSEPPLSPEEQRELAPLLPRRHRQLCGKKMARKVQESKAQLILELVLEDRVRTLLEFGADPNPEKATRTRFGSYGFKSPLAANSRMPSVARLLLEAKADPNQVLFEHQKSRLWTFSDFPEIVRLLLEAGADPHHMHFWGNSLTDPVQECLFLSFIEHDAPAESFRLLLEHNPEIFSHDSKGGMRTPISAYVSSSPHPRHVRDIVLGIPYPIPEKCSECEDPQVRGCWGWGPQSLRALIHIGYPVRERFGDTSWDYAWPANMQEKRDEILWSVTEEGQAQRRLEYLGGFWSALMRVVPCMSGVVASLVLQAIVPEFQLRIA